MVTTRRLGPGDEDVLTELALDDVAFDAEGRGRVRTAIPAESAAEYLADPQVLHWVAEDDGAVVGHLLCYVQRRRADDPLQVMLYEIGVRDDRRRQGVGRELIAAMESWMRTRGIASVWVIAVKGGAEAFYAACGFVREDPQGVQMERRL